MQMLNVKKSFLILSFVFCVVLHFSLSGIAASPLPERQRPNVLFFLVDDMGWMDSSLYGSEYYETPAMERLSKRGVRFTNAYTASPLCSPTRASIMTGCYPCRFGITMPACHKAPPKQKMPKVQRSGPKWAPMRCPVVERFLPLEEYTVAEALRDAGYATGFIGKWHLGAKEKWWPHNQGFEVNIAGTGFPGPPSYFSPYQNPRLKDGPKGEYITDRLTDEAIGYMKDHKDGEKPFFLCLWHFAVHAPFQGQEALIEKYRKRKDPCGKQDCPTMGAMLEAMDTSLGRILDYLDETGLSENTIIIFASDNGGNMYNTVDGTTPTNNAPLRNGKGNNYEGGVRTPALVVWPKVVKPDSCCEEVISTVDWYPTILEMLDIRPKEDKVFDGVSIVSLLKGGMKLDREAIFSHFPHYVPATYNLPSTFVRKGDWKLLRFYGEGPDRGNGYELYNLKEDVGESNNLAEKYPEKVKELDRLITKHLKETNARIPLKNPNYDPNAYNAIKHKETEGWAPYSDCEIEQKDGCLKVTCTGNDPFMIVQQPLYLDGRGLVLKIRMKSNASGDARVYWNNPMRRERSTGFKPVHDGKWHEYRVKLPLKGNLVGLRLDPASGPGKVEIDWIELFNSKDEREKLWSFDAE